MLMSLSETISISICDIAVQFCGHMQDTLGTVEEKQQVEQTDTKWTFLLAGKYTLLVGERMSCFKCLSHVLYSGDN